MVSILPFPVPAPQWVSETATAKQQLDSLLVGFQQVFYG